MTTRWQLTVSALCALLATSLVHADISRWDSGDILPGTEGITPGPGVQLDHLGLEYASLSWKDLTDANFEGSNLTQATLRNSTLTNANLTETNLTDFRLRGATLTGAKFDGAVLTGVDLREVTANGFTREQLYSTASYQAGDLQEMTFSGNDLSGWNFSGQNLVGALLPGSTLIDGSLAGANLTNAWLTGSTLTNVNLSHANLTDTHLTGSILANTDLTDAIVTGALFNDTTRRGFTKEQFYATASYRQENLQGIGLAQNDLTGWDFNGQGLTNANFQEADLANADFRGGNLKNATLSLAQGMESSTVDFGTVYNQWTVFPDGIEPNIAGLTFAPSPVGDFNASDTLDVDDIAMLVNKIQTRVGWEWRNAVFDVNSDEVVNREDHRVWVRDLKHTWVGDANLDGKLNSSDMIQVFAAGKYEKDHRIYRRGTLTYVPTSWSEGDWNGDGVFDSSDMVTAFTDGGYEKGPRLDAAAVPEPGGWLLLSLAAACLCTVQRGR